MLPIAPPDELRRMGYLGGNKRPTPGDMPKRRGRDWSDIAADNDEQIADRKSRLDAMKQGEPGSPAPIVRSLPGWEDLTDDQRETVARLKQSAECITGADLPGFNKTVRREREDGAEMRIEIRNGRWYEILVDFTIPNLRARMDADRLRRAQNWKRHMGDVTPDYARMAEMRRKLNEPEKRGHWVGMGPGRGCAWVTE